MFPIGDVRFRPNVITPYVELPFSSGVLLVFGLLQPSAPNVRLMLSHRAAPKSSALTYRRSKSCDSSDRFTYMTLPLERVYFNFLEVRCCIRRIYAYFRQYAFFCGCSAEAIWKVAHIQLRAFYIVTGLAAAVAQIVMNADSVIPMLSASGDFEAFSAAICFVSGAPRRA